MVREKRGDICTVETSIFTIYSPKEYPGRLCKLKSLICSFFKVIMVFF